MNQIEIIYTINFQSLLHLQEVGLLLKVRMPILDVCHENIAKVSMQKVVKIELIRDSGFQAEFHVSPLCIRWLVEKMLWFD